MRETSFDRDLAQAAIDAIEERSYGHPAMHPIPLARLVAEVLPQLSSEHPAVIPSKLFDEAVQKVATEASLKAKGPDELKTILRAYRLLRQEHSGYRILKVPDAAPWLGFDEVSAPHLNQRERVRYFAHSHMQAYPELLDVVELFSPPGRTPTDAARSLHDRFVFTRKVNGNVAAYLIDVVRSFELAATLGNNETLRNVWAPPTLLAALVVRRYLELTGFVLDRGIETSDILRQCTAVIPGAFFQQHPADTLWYRALRAPPSACLREVGGAQIRIGSEGLLWFARAGLLAPIQCAYVLRVRGAKESFGRLREKIMKRVESFLPLAAVNAHEIERDLAGE